MNTEPDDLEPNECARCHETFDVPFDKEPTKYCHDCAHFVVEELEAKLEQVTKERDELRHTLGL